MVRECGVGGGVVARRGERGSRGEEEREWEWWRGEGGRVLAGRRWRGSVVAVVGGGSTHGSGEWWGEEW